MKFFSHKGTRRHEEGVGSGGSVPPGRGALCFEGGVWGWQALPLWLGALVRKSALPGTSSQRCLVVFIFARRRRGAEKLMQGSSPIPISKRISMGMLCGSSCFFSAPPRLCARKGEKLGSSDMNFPEEPENQGVWSPAFSQPSRRDDTTRSDDRATVCWRGWKSCSLTRRSGWSGGSVPPGRGALCFGVGVRRASPSFVTWCLTKKGGTPNGWLGVPPSGGLRNSSA